MSPDDSRCLQMTPDESRWLQMIPDGSKCLQMISDASRWLQMPPDPMIIAERGWNSFKSASTLQRVFKYFANLPIKRYVFLNIWNKYVSKGICFWYMVTRCISFYEGHFLKSCSLSATMQELTMIRTRINRLRDQPFEQSMIIYIYIYTSGTHAQDHTLHVSKVIWEGICVWSWGAS